MRYLLCDVHKESKEGFVHKQIIAVIGCMTVTMEKGSEISKFSGRRISYRPQAALPTPPEMGPSSLAFSSDGNDVHLIWDSGRSGDMQVISTALSQSGVPVLQFETDWFSRSSEKSRDHLCPAFGKKGKSCDGTGGTHRVPDDKLYSRFPSHVFL